MTGPTSSLLIEFAGSPRSGKDTLIARLTESFRRRRIPFFLATEGARSSRIDKANAAELMYWTIGRSALDYADAVVAARTARATIFNRGLFDRLAWVRAYARTDAICQATARHWESFLLSAPSGRISPQIFLFITSPQIILDRARATQGADGGSGRVLNERFLNILNDCYLACAEEHAHRFRRIELIDERTATISLDAKFENIRGALFAREDA